MKEAVAMKIDFVEDNSSRGGYCCFVSTYCPNNTSLVAARKERLRSSAISRGDCIWLGIEPHDELYEYEENLKWVFAVDKHASPVSSADTYVTDQAQAFLTQLNAHSVQCLWVDIDDSIDTLRFVKKLFSLDPWKEAFPSLRIVYLEGLSFKFDLPPNIFKRMRVLDVQQSEASTLGEDFAVLRQMESLIRSKDCGIEEDRFIPWLLKHTELLDDTLRRVRSFEVELDSQEDVDLLARSFERTKADGDNLVRLELAIHRATATVERIFLRSRPNLQILNLRVAVSLSTFVVLSPVFASSILTTLKVGVFVQTETEDETLADGVEMLLQHPTIRDLDVFVKVGPGIRPTSQVVGGSAYHFERCVAEGLRSTSLRRFHLTVDGYEEASDAALAKMYENARENWSLMDIRLTGDYWFPWSSTWRRPSRPLPFHKTAFHFISSRNQHFSMVVMMDENTLPPGLWPLILEWGPRWHTPWSLEEMYGESVLFYLLTVRPHLVKGSKVESSVNADTEKSVDDPRPKRIRTT